MTIMAEGQGVGEVDCSWAMHVALQGWRRSVWA
jgi:hypothetical protein